MSAAIARAGEPQEPIEDQPADNSQSCPLLRAVHYKCPMTGSTDNCDGADASKCSAC